MSATSNPATIAAQDAETLRMLVNTVASVRCLLNGAMAIFSHLSRELDTDEEEIGSFLVSGTETLIELDELEVAALAALGGEE